MRDKIFAIVVTYNGMQWIDRCLESLLHSSVELCILVIDNNSTDNTVAHIRSHYPEVQVFCTGKNLGFGGGNNLGLKKALEQQADYVFLLNQDAWVEKETVQRLVAAQKNHPEYGILSPVHMNGTGNDFDDHFYTFLIRAENKADLQRFLNKEDVSGKVLALPFVNAAAWLISLDCLIKTGGFDPLFFHYGEDDNYNGRASYKRFRTGVLLSEHIYHDKNRAEAEARPDVRKRLHSELTQFLVYASDLQRKRFRLFMLKRSVRHFLLFFRDCLLFDKDSRTFNGEMSKQIFLRIKAVSRSRDLYQSDAHRIFLD